MFDSKIYSRRRRRLIKKVNRGLILILGNVDSPINYPGNFYPFRQDSSFLYFFGLDHPGLAGVIDAETGEEFLYGDDAILEDIIWMGLQTPLKEKAVKVGVSNTGSFMQLFEKILETNRQGRKIHFLPPYRAENKLLLQRLLGIHSSKQQEYVSFKLIKAIVDLRSVKEDDEIKEIETACAVGYKMHVAAMKMAHPGTWEQAIARAIEGIAISGGGMLSFPTILTMNGQALHKHDHSNFLEEGRLLLVDAGAESRSHYASDHTRTMPVGGKFSRQNREIYNLVLAANNKAIELIRPGETYLNIHLEVCKVIAGGLKELGLMKGNIDEAVAAGAHALFMPHGLGHMMGLDVHDMEDLGQVFVGYDDEVRPSDQFGTANLRLGRRLQPGFVLTVEPGVYFIPELIEKWQNEKMHVEFINYEKLKCYRKFGGIRLEDGIQVTKDGCRILGDRIPITPEEVEKYMER